MDELILEPFAVVQHWRIASLDISWEDMLSEYLLALAQQTTQSGSSVVGHIKAMALFPDKTFLRISAIAPNRPVTIEGSVPAGLAELELTLNVLVYGLPRADIQSITDQVTGRIAQSWNAQVETKFISQPDSPAHHTHHHRDHDRPG